jgi:hypothetical protein
MPGEDKLRQLAAWYREFAERAGSPWIWEARLRRAKDLGAEADRVEAKLALVTHEEGTE